MMTTTLDNASPLAAKPALPKSVTILGRRWFQRTYGNTYNTAEIIVDGKTVHRTPKQYGYGDQYADNAFEWLVSSGTIPAPANSRTSSHWRHIREDLGIAYSYQAVDVARERDL